MKQLKIPESITPRNKSLNAYLSDISKYPLLSIDEELELIEKAHNGDLNARNKLIESNLRFVVSVAKQYQGQGIELESLINDGNIGLIISIDRFDPTRGFKFISYAVWWIRQSILHELAKNSRTVRLPLNQIDTISKISKVSNDFIQDNYREPTEEELAELSNIDISNIEDALKNSMKRLSLDSPLSNNDGDDTLLDIKANDDPEADADVISESLVTDIDRALSVLSKRERKIVKLFFGLDGPECTLEEIAEQCGLTRERVRQIKENAITKLKSPEIMNLLKSHLG